MRVVIDAHRRAVLEADARRALDLREQQIGLVLQPADFEAAAGDLAVLDLGAVVIRHELAAADLAKHLALVGQAGGALRDAANEQVRRPAIDRHGVDVGLRPRAVDDRLVIAGDETLGFAEPRDSQAAENCSSKNARALAPSESSSALARGRDRAARCPAPSDRLAASLRRYRPAAYAKRLVGRRDDRPRSSPRYRPRPPAHIGCR